MALTKENLLHMWRNIELFAIDEISMVSAEMLSKVEFRSQQLLQRPQIPWGGLATIFSGDPDQLPPVAATSIFASEAAPPKANAGTAAQQSYQDACRGLHLWQQLSHCVVLQYTHRTQGTLNDILAAMRAGHMPDALWRALLARVLQPNDLRSAEPQFWSPNSCVGVLRHRIRSLATVHRAQALASASGQRLILVLPADRCWTSETSLHDPALLQYLTRIDNLTTTKNLAGCLFLWHGAMLVLEHKLDEAIGLVRGCTATVRRILLHPNEPPFSLDPNLEPHILCYVPCGLILHTTEATFRHSNLLQENEFLIEPCSRTWTLDLNPDRVPGISLVTADALTSSSLTILRRQLPVNNTLACTAYNLQGKTLTGMFADLALPPGMKRVAWTSTSALFIFTLSTATFLTLHSKPFTFPLKLEYFPNPCPQEEYWLSIYVLLSRLPDLNSLLLLRPPDRNAIAAGPPPHLRATWTRLQALQQATVTDVDRKLSSLQHTHLQALLRPLLDPVSASAPKRQRQASQRLLSSYM